MNEMKLFFRAATTKPRLNSHHKSSNKPIKSRNTSTQMQKSMDPMGQPRKGSESSTIIGTQYRRLLLSLTRSTSRSANSSLTSSGLTLSPTYLAKMPDWTWTPVKVPTKRRRIRFCISLSRQETPSQHSCNLRQRWTNGSPIGTMTLRSAVK